MADFVQCRQTYKTMAQTWFELAKQQSRSSHKAWAMRESAIYWQMWEDLAPQFKWAAGYDISEVEGNGIRNLLDKLIFEQPDSQRIIAETLVRPLVHWQNTLIELCFVDREMSSTAQGVQGNNVFILAVFRCIKLARSQFVDRKS